MNIFKINCPIDIMYKNELIKLIEGTKHLINDYNKNLTVPINGYDREVEIKISATKDCEDTKYSPNGYLITIAVKVHLDDDISFFMYKDIVNIEDLTYGTYLLEQLMYNSDIFYLVKLQFDEIKSKDYYKNKRDYIDNNIDEDNLFLKGMLYWNSFTNVLERLELTYALLINKVKTGKLIGCLEVDYLIEKLAMYGYDESLEKPVKKLNPKNREDIYNYYMYLLLNNLIGAGRKPAVNKLLIDEFYDEYLDTLIKY